MTSVRSQRRPLRWNHGIGSRTTGISVTDAMPEASFSEGLATPRRLAVDSLGDVYVVDRGSSGLTVVDLLTGEVVYRLPLPGVRSVAVDWEGRLPNRRKLS